MSTRTCPICSRPQNEAYKPFCSRRCADVDLQRWFAGVYAVPAEEEDVPGEDVVSDPRAAGQG